VTTHSPPLPHRCRAIRPRSGLDGPRRSLISRMRSVDVSDLAVEVLRRDPSGGWSVGSGYRVGDALVLTAAHNVGDGELWVRVRGTNEWPAEIGRRGDPKGVDLAVLRILDPPFPAPPCRYGEVDRSSPALVRDCWAVGFPRFKEHRERDGDRRWRASEQVDGEIPTGGNLGRRLLTLRVASTPLGAPGIGERSEWEGMSGAVVLCDDVVVGVITEHHVPEGPSALSVVPISAIDDLPDTTQWWELLGVDRSSLERLPEPPWMSAVRKTGATIWTPADFDAGMRVVEAPREVLDVERGEVVDLSFLRDGRPLNLQERYEGLARRFDSWLGAETQRKRGRERVRLLWLTHVTGPHRSAGLLACLARGRRNGRVVCDAGTNLDVMAAALRETAPTVGWAPPVIAVNLESDQHAQTWTAGRAAVDVARNHFSSGVDPFPRIVVAGTEEQAQAAEEALGTRVEITPIDMGGRERRIPWVQPYAAHGTVYVRGLPTTTPDLVGRTQELRILRDAWKSSRTRIVTVVAYGGTGKSALVNTWFGEMRGRAFEGARRVFAWSFYSQGTRENLVSADLFVGEALAWLGDTGAAIPNPTARGLQLASLIKEHNLLLVLDGVEPLQHPLSAPHVGGQLTDDSIRALLEELAKPDWDGLCVVTTRVPLTDLQRFEADGSGKGPTVVRMDLRNLDDEAAVTLLRRILHRSYDFRDLSPVVREVQGHALAITLLGNYLRDVHRSDIAGRFDLEEMTVDVNEGGHARRIMESYVRWLDEGGRRAELAILDVIGLFDRPAEPDAMSALLTASGLRSVMAQLDGVGGAVWNRAVEELRGMGLLNGVIPDQPGALDAHPLVRQHFRDKLIEPEMRHVWLEGNRALYAHYRDTAPARPDNVKGMSRLYAAVTHGCAADLHQQVYDQVLLPRVWRDRRTSFSTRHLAMTGADLVALSNYFRTRWTTLLERRLTARARVLVLTNSGVRLRQLGRLADARECFGAVVREIDKATATTGSDDESSTSTEESEDGSYAAAQSCELLVIAGKLTGADEALVTGERAIRYADRGETAYFRMHARSSLAEVHYMRGDVERASELFREAMEIDARDRPRPPFLYSQSLFRYGYYLIESNRAREIIDRARDDSWGTNGDDSSLLSRAIRSLVLGAAHRALAEAGDRDPDLLQDAERILDEAIVAFRAAGYADYLVRGLIERVHFYRIRRHSDDYGSATGNLERAAFEAERGEMKLLDADVQLQQVACELAFWPMMGNTQRREREPVVLASLRRAEALVREIGYGRRMPEVARLRHRALELGVAQVG
jgi:tetratricopeptide (TPR) repeat protein